MVPSRPAAVQIGRSARADPRLDVAAVATFSLIDAPAAEYIAMPDLERDRLPRLGLIDAPAAEYIAMARAAAFLPRGFSSRPRRPCPRTPAPRVELAR